MLARAAAFTASTRCDEASSKNRFTPIFGLVMMLRAPAANACMVVSAPCSVNEEHTTTGVGRVPMTCLRKEIPSMRGISTSNVMTSGHSFFMCSMANSGSDATPMTRMA